MTKVQGGYMAMQKKALKVSSKQTVAKPQGTDKKRAPVNARGSKKVSLKVFHPPGPC